MGDTIASVVLSLVDDVTLAERVGSLRSEIANIPPFGFNNRLTPIEKPFIDAQALEQLRLQLPNEEIAWCDFDADSLGESLQNLLERNHDVDRVVRHQDGRSHPRCYQRPK